MNSETGQALDPERLEKELSDYLSKKHGYPIKVIMPQNMSHTQQQHESGQKPQGLDRIQFDLKPEELEEYLNQFVVKQESAKAILATKICTHYNRVKLERRKGPMSAGHRVGRIKNNIILIGPTGVGKTYLVKLIADRIGVPFVKGDATKFSETGYVGGDVEDLVRDLVGEAGDDIELAQHGIIYVDEIDKIASSTHVIGPDVSRKGVQRTLLKPMEETEVDLKTPHDAVSQLQAIDEYRRTGKREKRTVNTRNILFIVSGAFNELAGIVKNRMQKQGIGFGAEILSKQQEHQFLQHVKAEDLIAYGFESEFVGRLPVVSVLDPLEVEDLYDILKNPNNPIIQAKKEDFRCYGIDVRFEDEALRLLAEMAADEKTGARGLVSVIEKVILPYEKKLPSTTVRHLVVTREVVLDPQGELERFIADPDDPERMERYRRALEEEKSVVRQRLAATREKYQEKYPHVFTPRRLEAAIEHHVKNGMPVESIMDGVVALHQQIKDFEAEFQQLHGFRIGFDEQAVDEVIDQALGRGVDAAVICKEISRDYDYGFRLISERTGQTRFTLTKQAVTRPDLYLDDLIRNTYRRYPLGPGGKSGGI